MEETVGEKKSALGKEKMVCFAAKEKAKLLLERLLGGCVLSSAAAWKTKSPLYSARRKTGFAKTPGHDLTKKFKQNCTSWTMMQRSPPVLEQIFWIGGRVASECYTIEIFPN